MANSNTTGIPASNGTPLQTTASNNPFFDGLNQISSVLFGGLDAYGSFLERKNSVKALQNESANPPMQTTDGTGFFTNSENIQKVLLYAGTAVLIGVAAFYVVKKA